MTIENTTIEAQVRERIGSNNSRTLRKRGRVPAVIYGSGDPIHISLDGAELGKLVEARRRVFDVQVDGQPQRVLMKDLQFDVFGSELLHVDLLRVTDDQVVQVLVPIEFSGTPKGLLQGGITEYTRYELEIQAPAGKVPSQLPVNIDHLEVGKVLHADEVALPDGVSLAPKLDPRGSIVGLRAAKKKVVKREEGEEGEAAEEAAA